MMGPAETSALRERKRILDDVTVWMLLVVSVAVAVPWFLRLLPIDLSVVARATFGFTLLYIALATLTDRLRGPRSLRLALLFLQASGIVFLGLLWHLVGGLQVPMFAPRVRPARDGEWPRPGEVAAVWGCAAVGRCRGRDRPE